MSIVDFDNKKWSPYVGYTMEPSVTAHDLMEHSALDDALQTQGINATKLVADGKKLLRGKKIQHFKLRKGDPSATVTVAKGVKIIAETDVEVLIEMSTPDLSVIQRQVQDFHKLMGHYPADRVKLDVAGHLNVADVSQLTPEELDAYEQAARLAEDLIAKASIEKRTAAIREREAKGACTEK